MPEYLPDRILKDMPEDMPNRMPDRMPDRMPENMSEYMAPVNDMSDRMPELPIPAQIYQIKCQKICQIECHQDLHR